MVKLSGNAGLYHVSGRIVTVPADGEVTVSKEEAKVLLGNGFKEVKPAPEPKAKK